MIMDKIETKLRCIDFACQILPVHSSLTYADEKEPILRPTTDHILIGAKKLYKWVSSEKKDEE